MRSSPPAFAPCICDVALLLENKGMARESQGKLRTEREQSIEKVIDFGRTNSWREIIEKTVGEIEYQLPRVIRE